MAAAVEEARQGRPEAMADRLGEGGKEDARTAFLRGVSYYASGNVPAALTQLQAALRLDSELFPAAVYMGGCYAAEGKDLDAIGAWQTALIGEVGSPVLYALLSDALVRAKEEEQALAILSEGLAAFPDDAGLRRRLGMAYAMAGRAEEALPAAHRVGGHPPGGPAGPLRHAGPALRGILARDGGGGAGGGASAPARATRRPTWTARARTAR